MVHNVQNQSFIKKIPIKFDGKFRVKKTSTIEADIYLYSEENENGKMSKLLSHLILRSR
jgi:hypothetical protein